MKTIAQIIGLGIPGLARLREKTLEGRARLEQLKIQYPDAAAFFDKGIEDANELLAELDKLADGTSLISLGSAIWNELKSLPDTGLSPVSRPSDTTGG